MYGQTRVSNYLVLEGLGALARCATRPRCRDRESLAALRGGALRGRFAPRSRTAPRLDLADEVRAAGCACRQEAQARQGRVI